MPRRKKTAFDRYFDSRMKDPEFAAAYTKARAVIDSTDALIRALDKAQWLVWRQQGRSGPADRGSP